MSDPFQFDAAAAMPILDRAFDGIALLTPSPWRVYFANRTLVSWFGKSAAELSGVPLESLLGEAWQRKNLEHQLNQVLTDPAFEIESSLSMELGSRGASPMFVRAFQVAGCKPPMVALMLRPQAGASGDSTGDGPRLDPLTSLPDRTFLLSRLATLLDGDRVADREFAVLFIDVDNFKQVNDRSGHLIGDLVIRDVANRLKSCVRDCDHVARYGGDEFVVLLERTSDTSDIEPVLARIREAFSEPLVVSNARFALSLSIGVAMSAPHLLTPEDVIGEADRQMYAAKRGVAMAAISGEPTAC